MKVDSHLIVIKGQEAPGERTPQKPRLPRATSTPAFEVLISQENQRAQDLDPTSYAQARTLLITITRRLAQTPADSLSKTHLVDSSCLVRLP